LLCAAGRFYFYFLFAGRQNKIFYQVINVVSGFLVALHITFFGIIGDMIITAINPSETKTLFAANHRVRYCHQLQIKGEIICFWKVG
jgi:hypothetical protein